MDPKDPDNKEIPQLRVVDDEPGITRLETEKTSPPPHRFGNKNHRLADVKHHPSELVGSPQEVLQSTPEYEPGSTYTSPRITIPPGFLILFALIFIALGISGIALLIASSSGEANQIREKVEINFSKRELERKEARRILSTLEEATKGYLGAKTVEEKARFVRQPERVIPLMHDYYKSRLLIPRYDVSIISQSPLDIENQSFIIVLLKNEDGRTFNLLTEFNEDKILFDWESEVCYQPMKVEDFIAQKPTQPILFRVFVKPDNHYTHQFADSDKFQSLLISFRDSHEYLFAYVDRNDPFAEDLRLHILKSQNLSTKSPIPVVLKLAYPPSPKHERLVHVEDYVAPRWILLDNQSQ
ncbi:MAG: hypothetical protein AAGC74_08020 [Verrucomicrobiota bacterium]